MFGGGDLLLLCAGIYLCTNYTAKSHIHGLGAFKNYVLKYLDVRWANYQKVENYITKLCLDMCNK